MTTKWEYKKSSFFPAEDVLNLWGSQGWEYIAARNDGMCLFKRLKPEETERAEETAPEPEVSVTLTYSDLRFLQNKWNRWVYPKVEATEITQFDRIGYEISKAASEARRL